MNRAAITFLGALLGTTCMVLAGTTQAARPLQVIFDGCQPTKVISVDNTCGQGQDPDNVSCSASGAAVRWSPVNRIDAITKKADSAGDLHNCMRMEPQGYYQCIVLGNVDDEVYYDVRSTEGCVLDPKIIITLN